MVLSSGALSDPPVSSGQRSVQPPSSVQLHQRHTSVNENLHLNTAGQDPAAACCLALAQAGAHSRCRRRAKSNTKGIATLKIVKKQKYTD
jgi:hypothetical protein